MVAAEDPTYLRTLESVRERSAKVYAYVAAGKSAHWQLHVDRLGDVAEYIVGLMERDYGLAGDALVDCDAIPPHTRWRHHPQAAIDALLASIDDANNGRCRALVDLFAVSVLLDAGAGPRWQFRAGDGKTYSRSEGIAMAVLDMFRAGKFGKQAVDAKSLLALTPRDMQEGFQATGDNPIVGLEGRLGLMHSLGRTVRDNPRVFHSGRLSDFLDGLIDETVPIDALWSVVVDVLGGVWTSHSGDAWHHRGLNMTVPFHKLSQWLTYSLIEPIEALARTESGRPVRVVGAEKLTGLPEYRNGGLFIDFGVISMRNTASDEFSASDELIVEWRALTVVLIDRLADLLRLHPKVQAPALPLAKVLEGGTWKAGRLIARTRRPETGNPPINIKSDGTVF